MKNKYLALVFVLLLAACGHTPDASDTTAEETGDTEREPAEQVIDFPTDSDDDTEHYHHDHAMETAVLKEGCQALTTKLVAEKKKILSEIGHHMDHGVLQDIIGPRCQFLGPLQKVADLTTNDLKLMPKDNEVLYYVPATNQFFATCTSADTVAYVVDKRDASTPPEAYFANQRTDFVAAASMARKMMAEMMEDESEKSEVRSENENNQKQVEGEVEDDNEAQDDSVEQPEVEGQSNEDSGPDTASVFTNYSEGVIGNGKESVLFFAAAWCPKCQANKAKLTAWYGSEQFPRSIYEIDYDTATALKQKYGVVQQDTFVLIDGQGNPVQRVSFPSEGKLRELLGKA